MTYTFNELLTKGLIIAPKTQKPFTDVANLRKYLQKNGFKLRYIKAENTMRYVLTDEDIKKLNEKAYEAKRQS